MTVGVYTITCLGSGMRYIGGSVRSVENRFSHHIAILKSGRAVNPQMQKDFDEFGLKNFRFKISLICAKELVRSEEQFRIDYWKARNKCYNIHPNARSALGHKFTKEQRRLQSVKAKARCTTEWKKAVSERVKLQHKQGKLGQATWTEEGRKEARRKTGLALRGRPGTMLGKKHSAATKAKMSVSMRGNTNTKGHKNFLGGRHTEDARKRISKNLKKYFANKRREEDARTNNT